MRIQVLAADIKEGKAGKPDTCPIARAIERKLNQKVYVDILDDLPFVDIGTAQYDLPATCRKFIVAFDNGKVVKPFNFNLAIDVQTQ